MYLYSQLTTHQGTIQKKVRLIQSCQLIIVIKKRSMQYVTFIKTYRFFTYSLKLSSYHGGVVLLDR